MYKNLVFYFAVMATVSSCVSPNSTFEKLPPGIWRGVLLLDRQPIQKYGDDRDIEKRFDSDSELPFNFEVVYDDSLTFHIVIHNGEERIEVKDIFYGRDKATAKDTIIIDFPIFDTYIKAIYEDGVMEGDWVVNYRDGYKIPFKAVHGTAERFTGIDNSAPVDFAGTWKTTFEIGTEDQYDAVGIFEQDGFELKGTFLTETGDYRFLDGITKGNKLYLSAFDGAHAFLFLGKLQENKMITGTFRSGTHYTTNWEAKLDSTAKLRDPYTLTGLANSSVMNFSFKNTEGDQVSINDEKYKDKIKIIQIMGTWCPNCMDETKFLKEYFQKNQLEGVELITIGFERYKDDAKSLAALKRFKEKMDITHEVLYGGYYDKESAVEKIPQLDKIMSYPTLLFVDKNNHIFKIHTGFAGPATSEYKAFNEEFGSIIEAIKSK